MDNSSLIPYYNTQSELKVLTFGEIMYYQSNNLTTRAIGLCPSFLFLYSGLFDWLHLHCRQRAPIENDWSTSGIF